MPKDKESASDAVEILYRRHYRRKPQQIARLKKALAEDELARKIHQLREEAGLTQARLARMIGTTESVISRLENSDYSDTHSGCSAVLRMPSEGASKSDSCHEKKKRSGLNTVRLASEIEVAGFPPL